MPHVQGWDELVQGLGSCVLKAEKQTSKDWIFPSQTS